MPDNQHPYDPPPSHYKVLQGPIQCWDAIDQLGLREDYYLASAFAYLWRAGRKPGANIEEDIHKAHNYLGRWLETEAHASVSQEAPEYAAFTEPPPLDIAGQQEPRTPIEMTLMDRLRASIRKLSEGETPA